MCSNICTICTDFTYVHKHLSGREIVFIFICALHLTGIVLFEKKVGPR